LQRTPNTKTRLLNTSTHAPETFHASPPLYAILSHRWRSTEVAFQDLESGIASSLPAYDKILRTCAVAAEKGTDSIELSEVINSMYRWYEEATVCYVHLADVSVPPRRHLSDYIIPSGAGCPI
jgi:hypothetical protein